MKSGRKDTINVDKEVISKRFIVLEVAEAYANL